MYVDILTQSSISALLILVIALASLVAIYKILKRKDLNLQFVSKIFRLRLKIFDRDKDEK